MARSKYLRPSTDSRTDAQKDAFKNAFQAIAEWRDEFAQSAHRCDQRFSTNLAKSRQRPDSRTISYRQPNRNCRSGKFQPNVIEAQHR